MSNKKTNTPATETKSVKRGRPIVAGSKRQAVLAMRDAKRNAGIEIKRGRPKIDRKSTRLNSSHSQQSRMPSSA